MLINNVDCCADFACYFKNDSKSLSLGSTTTAKVLNYFKITSNKLMTVYIWEFFHDP